MEEFLTGFLNIEEEELRKLLEPLIVNEGFELVRIKVRRAQSVTYLTLYIDTKDQSSGVILQGLEDISRLVGDVLEAHAEEYPILKRHYELEVSSPGLDRPLYKLSHFNKAVGEKVKIRLKPSDSGAKSLIGVLNEVFDDGVAVLLPSKDSDGITKVLFQEMSDAHVIFQFEDKSKPKKSGRVKK